ncbi:mRNA cleavage and polyadenylation factor IA/II complex [Purpureocillium lilacinum]|uniref:Polynucleotide 5'-hydroxyl-kinase GRC3 n=1 Tax=Purpureocillium lilacinum TaxID=33203 RepID=A0A179HBI4_PURLI|nr:mRNA cleavage and polyadenylation factor IA/II complex [Purpureocillium lilacinum]
MSIPGLGQIPTQQAATSSTRVVSLKPAWEWRFQIPVGRSLGLKVLSGTAEKDGIELAPRSTYTLPGGTASKILTWHGCELEIEGRSDNGSDSVAEYATPAANPANAHVNLHARLSELRAAAAREGREGPRVLITGHSGAGKTALTRTLTSYATRQGEQPLTVNTEPRDGMLSLPGTLSAAVFATVMDPEARDGWGGTPTSGPSVVPVKLPLVYFYGRADAEEEPDFYKALVSRLAGAVSGRLSEDVDVRSSGVLVDGTGLSEDNTVAMDLLAHVVDELSINIVVVLGSTPLHAELGRRFASERTSLGEPIQVVGLDQSDGVVERDESFAEHVREQIIKEYFFGDAKRTLSPQIQQVDFDSLIIYKVADDSEEAHGPDMLVREEPSSLMQHWTLAVMHAANKDPAETVRAASVMGFVYVSDVDEERRKVKVLAPIGGRLGDRPLVWGRWPEPYMNLLG